MIGALRRSPSPRVAAMVFVVLATPATACGFGGAQESVTPSTDPPAEVTFVAIGGDETVEQDPDSRRRELWARKVFREHLPAQATFADLAEPGATAADAIVSQVPRALELEPTVVTVWLSSGDAAVGTPGGAYQSQMDELVGALAATGTQVALIVGPDTPEVYAAASAALAGRYDAVLVELDADRDQDAIATAVAEALALD